MKNIRNSWIISDTHFLHKRVRLFCARPSNYQELIIRYWKELIKPNDIIYHLGDVIFGNKKQLSDFMEDLPGTKILIRGNHDKNHSNNFFIDAGFNLVCDSIRINRHIILSHKPIKLYDEDKINIHGHFHNITSKNWEPELKEILTDNHYLYSIEENKYKPILLKNPFNPKILIKSKYV